MIQFMNDSQPSDQSIPQRDEIPSLSTSLLQRARQMNAEAWGRIVDVFSPIIYRWARTSGLAAEDAADAVQDVLAAVARNLERFERERETGSFRSWLATITRNRIRDHYRIAAKQVGGRGGTAALNLLENVPAPGDPPDLEQSVTLESLNRQIPNQVLEIVQDRMRAANLAGLLEDHRR